MLKDKKSVVIRIRPDTRQKLKVGAAKRNKSLVDHVEDLSKLPIKDLNNAK